MIEIVLVAAVADNGVIGRDGDMPWRLKSDLQRFRARTIGKPVVMGRRTFESLVRPLKGRTNIVVSRDRNFSAPGIIVAADLARALETARGDALRRGVNEIVIGGGSHIYAALMPVATRLEITEVHARPAGDTVFPPIDPAVWRLSERVDPAPAADDSTSLSWVTYVRADAPPASRI